MERVYLDAAAAAPIDPRASDVMRSYIEGCPGNPSSVHYEGRHARLAIDAARRKIACLLGCEHKEVVFTSGGTEANHLGLWGALLREDPQGQHVLVGAVEHPSVLASAHSLTRLGARVEELPADRDGAIDPERAADRVTSATTVVAVQLANHEVGTVQRVSELVKAVKARSPRALVLCDAVAAIGQLSVDVDRLGVDLLSISSLKIGGPYGAGALYVRAGTRLRGVIGGGDQERSRRAGTENLAAIVGLGKAAELLQQERPGRVQRLAQLRTVFLEALARTGVAGWSVNGPCRVAEISGENVPCVLPGVMSVTFEEAPADTVLVRLDREGIAISAGSACAAGSLLPSSVLLAMGRTASEGRSTLRISPPWSTEPTAVAWAAERVACAVEAVRGAHGRRQSQPVEVGR